jgi:hypothetical protein
MLSPGDIAKIKADIERLEKVRDECADSGIRKLIEAWIEEQKQIAASLTIVQHKPSIGNEQATSSYSFRFSELSQPI